MPSPLAPPSIAHDPVAQLAPAASLHCICACRAACTVGIGKSHRNILFRMATHKGMKVGWPDIRAGVRAREGRYPAMSCFAWSDIVKLSMIQSGIWSAISMVGTAIMSVLLTKRRTLVGIHFFLYYYFIETLLFFLPSSTSS